MMMSWKINFLFFYLLQQLNDVRRRRRPWPRGRCPTRARRVRIPSTLYTIQFMFSLRPASSSSKTITLQFAQLKGKKI